MVLNFLSRGIALGAYSQTAARYPIVRIRILLALTRHHTQKHITRRGGPSGPMKKRLGTDHPNVETATCKIPTFRSSAFASSFRNSTDGTPRSPSPSQLSAHPQGWRGSPQPCPYSARPRAISPLTVSGKWKTLHPHAFCFL